jgi:CMP-N,N'-diacetyllegionaminic acid synthase
MLWATSPLRTKDDIINSYKMLDKDTNAVISVTNYDLPVWCAQEVDKNRKSQEDFSRMNFGNQAQEVPSRFCDNGSICWIKTKAFLQHKNWFPPLSKGYEMPKERSIDIDTQFDLDFAEYMYGKNKI